MHCLLISFGSAETQRGEDAVSGSRMPTFVFAGAAVPAELPEELLLPQPASPATSAMAAPVIAAIRSDVRIGASFLIAAGILWFGSCRPSHRKSHGSGAVPSWPAPTQAPRWLPSGVPAGRNARRRVAAGRGAK